MATSDAWFPEVGETRDRLLTRQMQPAQAREADAVAVELPDRQPGGVP